MSGRDFILEPTLAYLQDRELTTYQVNVESIDFLSSFSSSSEGHWKTRGRRLGQRQLEAGASLKVRPCLGGEQTLGSRR